MLILLRAISIISSGDLTLWGRKGKYALSTLDTHLKRVKGVIFVKRKMMPGGSMIITRQKSKIERKSKQISTFKTTTLIINVLWALKYV